MRWMRTVLLVLLLLRGAAGQTTVVVTGDIKATSSVVLTWDAATTGDPALNFNVYRSEVQGGPYHQVALAVPLTVWVDATVAPGKTYYYVVTGVNLVGESNVSNEATARIP